MLIYNFELQLHNNFNMSVYKMSKSICTLPSEEFSLELK